MSVGFCFWNNVSGEFEHIMTNAPVHKQELCHMEIGEHLSVGDPNVCLFYFLF